MSSTAVIVPEVLTDCRSRTEQKLAQLVDGLNRAGAPEIVRDRGACVYATGSLGRGEMSERSDLDIFVLRDDRLSSPLTNLDAIRLTARLIEVARAQGYPDFSGDGKFIKAHNVHGDLIGKLGTSEDDYVNVFTARMLLVLESIPILGEATYKRVLEDVVATYWRDYTQNMSSFLPVFLTNDILRFWKTLCLNYEERTGAAKDINVGKRRLHNYKLKHSRLLTCYSAIIYIQAVLQICDGTVSPESVMSMISTSPTGRLEYVAKELPGTETIVQGILDKYAKFLQTCTEEKGILEDKFSESSFKQSRFEEARDFGDEVFALLHQIGDKSPLLRYLVI